jgi:DNA helicase HerA-like ATPase
LAVAVLLLATIAYVAVLNRRLGLLRDDKAQLEKLIQGLNTVVNSAQSGVTELHQAANEVGKDLDKKVTTGQALRDDLNYLIERGGSLADRLEGTIRARRTETVPRAPDAPRPAVSRAAGVDKVMPLRGDVEDQSADRPASPISRAERDLIRALGGRR